MPDHENLFYTSTSFYYARQPLSVCKGQYKIHIKNKMGMIIMRLSLNEINELCIRKVCGGHYIQIYHVWEGYLRKIPVERRNISRAEWRGQFSLKTGIFRKYPSQT